VQRYYFDGNNKRHLYPCAASIVEVVERGSFTAAAKELNLTQPAVTHQVQELERRFKVALVERFGKHAYLTQAAAAVNIGASSSGRPPPRPPWHPCRRCR
jgi:Bacterial regulatory helix-turn-helix protein, lysR family